MWWEITGSTADTAGAYFEATNVINPGFAGPPLHAHPHAEESYAVIDGVLDVCVAGTWRRLIAGESLIVPAGVAHTLRNSSAAEVRLTNRHAPALQFERFFRRLHAMAAARTVTLPPRGFGSVVRLSMLFTDHEQEIVSVKPPRAAMRPFRSFRRPVRRSRSRYAGLRRSCPIWVESRCHRSADKQTYKPVAAPGLRTDKLALLPDCQEVGRRLPAGQASLTGTQPRSLLPWQRSGG